ncbi:MAG: hypothetical protein ACTSPD_13450 [Promethearchaeota archaeon]
MDSDYRMHSHFMDKVFENPKFPEAVDLWTSYFIKSKDRVVYSNWRYLNSIRQNIENKIFKSLIKPNSKVLDIGCSNGFFFKKNL